MIIKTYPLLPELTLCYQKVSFFLTFWGRHLPSFQLRTFYSPWCFNDHLFWILSIPWDLVLKTETHLKGLSIHLFYKHQLSAYCVTRTLLCLVYIWQFYVLKKLKLGQQLTSTPLYHQPHEFTLPSHLLNMVLKAPWLSLTFYCDKIHTT